MAARLPVVISQSARRDPVSVACEEKLVTELLFTSGLDATLIGPLESIELLSTDHLCLEGLKGPFALLSWTEISVSLTQFLRLGIHGAMIDRDATTPSPMPLTQAMGRDPHRRVDFFQLRSNFDPKTWIDSLLKILSTQEVKAFQIQLPGKAPPQAVAAKKLFAPEIDRSISTLSNAKVEVKTKTFQRTVDPSDEDEGWEHLDGLVADLDRFDA